MSMSIIRSRVYALINRVLLSLQALILSLPFLHRLLTRIRHIECYIIKGKTKSNGRELSVLFLGNPQSLYYLVDLVFSEPYQIRSIGQLTLKNAILMSEKIPSDIMFIESEGFFSGEFSRNFLILPHLTWILDITPSLESLITKMRRIRRRQIRVLQEAKYIYEYTNSIEKFKFFYNRMYVPYILKRYDKSATIVSQKRFVENFKTRGLFLVKSGGWYVSGISFNRKNYTIKCELLGIDPNANDGLAGQAALYGLIKWAKEKGFREIDYGRTTPFASDRVYWYKRTWGMRIKPYPDLIFGMHVNKLSDGVLDFLSSNPFVFLCNGDLIIVMLLNSDHVDPKSIYRKYYSLGLKGIIVIHKNNNTKIRGMTLPNKTLEEMLMKHLKFEKLRKKNYCAHVFICSNIIN